MGSKYHVRSISLPSRSHPTTLLIEEELTKLKTWEASYVPTSTSVSIGLSGLEELYKCTDDLLNMASTQQLLSKHRTESNFVDELLDGSVRLLDVCSTGRDILLQINEQVHVLQSAIRRRKGGDSTISNNIAIYNSLRKQTKKEAKKLVTTLKQMGTKLGVLPLPSTLDLNDHHLLAVIRVLKEVTETSVSIFRSLLSFLAAKTKRTGWGLVSKLMHKGVVVACEENDEEKKYGNELENVDVALCGCIKNDDFEMMGIAHKRLEVLEMRIEALENGVECVFRRLIRTRASLLNIISQ